MPQEPTTGVREEVQVTDRVTQMTRVFLAGAISLGAIASAMGFFLLPDVFEGGVSTTGTVPRNLPLKAVDVVRAVSVRDPLEAIAFSGQKYYVGNTAVYQQPNQGSPADPTYRNARINEAVSIRIDVPATSRNFFGIPTAYAQATPFSIESIQGATTFSIETIPFTGFTGQYVLLWYRQAGDTADRLMTLCLGQTDAQRVYVGTDGSTYTDSKLTRRTTTRSCAQLNTLNKGVEQVGDGDGKVSISGHLPGLYNVVRSTRIISRFQDSLPQYQDPVDPPLDQAILDSFRTPIWVGFAPPDPIPSPENPSALFYLTDDLTVPGQVTVQYLCYPTGILYNELNTGPVVFFDRLGNPYSDMFLTTRLAPNLDCGTIGERGLHFNTVTNIVPVSLNGTFPSNSVLRIDQLNYINPSYRASIGFTQGVPAEAQALLDPTSVFANPVNGGTFTVPSGTWSISGKNISGAATTITACIPELQYTNPTGSSPYPTVYLDATGQPYANVLLTQPLTCSAPTSTGGGGGPLKLPDIVE